MICAEANLWTKLVCRSIVMLLTIMVLSSAAAAQCIGPIPDPVGTWEWEWSMGGIAGVTLTPESEGYTLQFEFRADETLIRYRNETFEASAPYAISCVLGGWAIQSEAYFIPEFAWLTIVEGPEGRELHLQDACIDCFNHLFTERPPIGPIADEVLTWGTIKTLYR